MFSISCTGQNGSNFFTPSPNVNNSRLIPLVAGEGILYTGSMVWLDVLWYKNYPQSSFHFFDDNKEWKQMDKFGHCLTAYTISRLAAALYQWSGVKQLPASVYGTTLGMAFQTNIEVFDGFSSEWGFSYGDMIANTTGASIFLSQETGWGDQRIGLKISFHPTEYSQYHRAELGDNFLEQTIKDYNGQTYWVSIAIASFLPKGNKIPGWACLDFGYGAEGMVSAVTNPPVYNTNGDELSFDRYRKYFVSLDINLTKIPTRSAPLRAAFGAVSFIKIPFPALEFSRKKFHFHILYF
ncbi:MAG TPA: DUF2279 domain-containing protein [Bacteroidia bacterium]|jgi:hypothetical protein|nr:DUF2279 domain-containing protein [Bacteroidia bacterium]